MILKPTELRRDLYRILDRVLATGVPAEIDRDGKRLKIVPGEPTGRLASLPAHEGVIHGDPVDLAEIDWSSEWKPSI